MVNIITRYLEGFKGKLSELYRWDFNAEVLRTKFGITITGNTSFDRTINLRNALRQNINENNTIEHKIIVADYFIKEWGGITRFTKAKEAVEISNKVGETNVMPPNFTLKFTSISSFSKWASLVWPEWACIYDARVAYSLNAINYINGGKLPIFPMPEGRNSKLKILDIETLLLSTKITQTDNNEPKDIKKKYFIKEKYVYPEYLKIVNCVSRELWNDTKHIQEVEMLLFSLADGKIYRDVLDYLRVKSAGVPR